MDNRAILMNEIRSHLVDNLGFPLEAEVYLPTNRARRAIVLCHPHPLLGGSMNDPIVASCAKNLRDSDTAVVRFNFRGVGASKGGRGKYHQGERPLMAGSQPETYDLIAVTNWISHVAQTKQLFMIGYSFGANVVWNSLPSLDFEKAILIAPPTAVMPFRTLDETFHDRVVSIVCEEDHFFDREECERSPSSQVVILAGGDHFFFGESEYAHRRNQDCLREAN